MHFLSLASLALAVSGASAIVIPRTHVHHARHEKPDTYYEGYLEKYDTYHTRYMQIGCENQHGTAFFDKCCHPMLATETLEKNRAPECNPANRVSSTAVAVSSTPVPVSSSAAPAASQVLSTGGDDDDDEDCEDEEPTSVASSAAPTATDDDDDEDCEDDDEDESSTPVAQPTTHAASSTHASSTQAPVTTSTHSVTPSSTPSSTPTPTSTKSTASPTKATSSPTPTSGNSGSNKGPFTGNATFYYQNNQAGACGKKNPDSAFIAAMQTERYGDLSRQSALCGQQVKITNQKNGKTVVVTIADACPTCGTGNDIDLSEGAFTQIATKDEGEVPISWEFL
ncbi:RlpA-like double-psi beta-barrel-protein domain-containing protein-containing protein [Trametes polyzona]|nr:RlpA-like double-psi beta-barrel-protein domain-containing protein-containing protein [Trametes polyzona]